VQAHHSLDQISPSTERTRGAPGRRDHPSAAHRALAPTSTLYGGTSPYAGAVGKAPLAPNPPEPNDASPPTDLAELVDITAEGRDWANSRPVRGMTARRVLLQSCRLTGSELAEAKLSDVTFDDCRLDFVNFRFASLERVVFRDCRMDECDLYEASLKDVLLERCQLRVATLTSATFRRVELRGCSLDGLIGVESLRGSRMPLQDVLANAPMFAAAAGIEIID
jgi:hypothetical protein